MKKVCIEVANFEAKEVYALIYEIGGCKVYPRRLRPESMIINTTIPKKELRKLRKEVQKLGGLLYVA